MDENQKDQRGMLNIALSEAIAEGQYCNLAVITHSASEFVLDFVTVMPGKERQNVKARIILTPEHAKRLHAALGDNVKKFETAQGEIKTIQPAEMMASFGGPNAEA